MKKRLLAAVTALLLAAALSGSALAAPEVLTAVLDKAPRAMGQETPYLTQCELGSAVTDAFRIAGDTQIALVETAMLANDLSQGELTRADVERVFTADEPLVRSALAPQQLYALLEHAVGQVRVDPKTEHIAQDSPRNENFCQISGFTFRYDASAPAGERVVSVRLDDGAELERQDGTSSISVTAPASLLDGFEAQELDMTCVDALWDYVGAHTELPEGEQARITVLGARENTIVGMFPRWLLVAGIAVLAALLAVCGLRLKHHKEEFD